MWQIIALSFQTSFATKSGTDHFGVLKWVVARQLEKVTSNKLGSSA